MIIYSFVARGTLILAEYTAHDGDFPEIARKIIAKAVNSRIKTSYIKENYSFTFFSDDEFTFLVMSDSETTKSKVYGYLDELANCFYADYGGKNNKNNWNAEFTLRMRDLMVFIKIIYHIDEIKSFL